MNYSEYRGWNYSVKARSVDPAVFCQHSRVEACDQKLAYVHRSGKE